jgi:hypothetical protein
MDLSGTGCWVSSLELFNSTQVGEGGEESVFRRYACCVKFPLLLKVLNQETSPDINRRNSSELTISRVLLISCDER